MTDTAGALEFQETLTYHATAVAIIAGDPSLSGDAARNARWIAAETLVNAAGWRLLGWRCYAIGDIGRPEYRCVLDLYRTADDVRAGALQLTAPMR